MEEGEYRSTYHSVNQQRCIFEKSVLSRRADCCYAHRFCLADREGIACQDKTAQDICKHVLDMLRNNSLFALQLTRIDGPLPHAKEMKVQLGGLAGIKKALGVQVDTEQHIENVHETIKNMIEKFGSLDDLPYTEIARSVSEYKERKRGRSSRD